MILELKKGKSRKQPFEIAVNKQQTKSWKIKSGEVLFLVILKPGSFKLYYKTNSFRELSQILIRFLGIS